MPRKAVRILALLLCFFLIFEQSGFAQIAGQLNVSGYLAQLRSTIVTDKFRPLHLRYLAFNPNQNNFQLLLDKGDNQELGADFLKESSSTLLKYFLIGVTLPNSSLWVNLRPDSEERIIDDKLGQTDVGKILLEADLQLKKDAARFTSPQTPEGREYWDKLYKKAAELFGSSDVTIPTLTRPWIVPDEIIVRETPGSAYVYKATLKVMLEQDYLQGSAVYKFDDERLRELNEYSSQLIRDLIMPKITKEINNSKRYAPLRQVYYSLILAQWFKDRCQQKNPVYASLIDQENLTDLTSQEEWSKTTYFNAYQQSFENGEYNIKEPVNTLFGRSIRSYFSGGIALEGISQGVLYVQGNPDNALPASRYLAGMNGVIGVSPTDVGLSVGNVDQDNAGVTQESAAEPDLQSPGAGPGTPSAIEHPNNNVAQARELMEQGKLEEAGELLVRAIEMFNDLIARNADAPADTLDAEIARAAEHNLQIAQALLQDIKQRQQANQAITVGGGMEGGDSINEEARFSPGKILRDFREWFSKQFRPKTKPAKHRPSVNKDRFVDLEHFVAAQMKLARGLLTGQLLQDVLISLELAPTLTGEEATTQIYQRLIERNYPPEIIDMINQGTYTDPRLEVEIEYQNKGPRLQSIMEAVSNSLDALGFHIGQFGKGIKQILYWLQPNGVDGVKVVTRADGGKAYQLTIIRAVDGRLRINIQEISQAEFQEVARKHTGRELEKGTVLTVATIDPIPALDKDADKGHPVSQEAIIRKIKERYPFVTAVDIYTQESGQDAQVINGFEDMAVIVPAGEASVSTHESQGRFVQVAVGKFSIAVIDNGSGMNAQTLARMFVPREGDRDSPQLDTPEALQQELAKTKVVHCTGEKMPHRISFGRNGEVITVVDVSDDIVEDAAVSGGLLVECAGLMDVTEARDNIVLQQNLRGAGKTHFQIAIEHLFEKIIDHPTLTSLQKVRYINTIIIGLDGLVQGNANNEFVVSALRARAGELLAPILKKLEAQGYIILPHGREFARLTVAHKPKVIFLHEKLFQWQGAESLRRLGAQDILGVTVGGNSRLPVLVAAFTADSTQAVRNPDVRHLINLTQEERLSFIKQEGYMVVSEELGKQLMDLARKRSQLSPQEEKEFKSLLQRVNIVTVEEVFVTYEVAEVRPNVIIVDMNLTESVGEIDSPAINQFLVQPPVLAVQRKKQGRQEVAGIPTDARQRLILSGSGHPMEIGSGKVHKLLDPEYDAIECLEHDYYLLTSSWGVTLVSFKGGVVQPVDTISDISAEQVRISPDKRFVLVEKDNGVVQEVFDCEVGVGLPLDTGHVYQNAQFSKDGQYLVCFRKGKGGQSLQVYKRDAWETSFEVPLPKGKFDFQINSFANVVFVRDQSSGAMKLIDLENKQCIVQNAQRLHTNSAGTHTIVIEQDGTMGVYIHNGQLRKYITACSFRAHQDTPQIVNVDTRWLLASPEAKPYSIIRVADNKGSIHAWGLDADGNVSVVMPYRPGLSVAYETVALSGKKGSAVPVVSCTFQPRTSASNKTIAARLDRLDPMQRQEGAGLYKHPYFDLIINQVDPQNPMAIDPENDARLSFNGEITWHWRTSETSEEVCIVSYDGKDEYRSVSTNTNRGVLRPAVKINNSRKTVYDKTARHKYEVYFREEKPGVGVYYFSIFQDSADSALGRSVQALPIDTEKYTAVSFDGKYFVFSDPKTGEAMYLDPQNHDNLRPVAWQPAQEIQEERPREIAPPADARQKLALSVDGQPMEIGSGKVHKLLDHGYETIEYLFNDYYLLTSCFGVSLISFKGGKVQPIGNIGDLLKDQVLVSPNKKFLVVINADGSIEKIVDCENEKVHADIEAFSSLLFQPGSGPALNFYAPQFSRDGKYLTYLWKNADGLVFLVIFNTESRSFCSVVDLEKGDLEYAINPFAAVAFVRNKDTGRMRLVDLEDRRKIIAEAKFLRADSMGKYVVIVSENNEVMLYALPGRQLMGAAHFGQNIHSLELRYCKGKSYYKVTEENGGIYYLSEEATISPKPVEEEVYSEFIIPLEGKVTFFSRQQGVLVECRTDLLDPLQRTEKEGVYKHPQLDLVIDNTAPASPSAIDPSTGKKYACPGEIITYTTGLLQSWTGQELWISNNFSTDTKKLGRSVWKDDAVPVGSMVQLFEGEYLLSPYSSGEPQFPLVQLREQGIDAGKYTQVSFDGKYFIFTDPNTAEAVYLDPQDPDAPIFVAGRPQRQPQNSKTAQQPPADAMGKHVLLQNRRIVEAGSGEEVKSIGEVAKMIPLQNNCYLVNENGSWDILTVSWGKSSSMNQHPLTSNSSDRITVSPDKRLVVLTDSFGEVMEIYDAQDGRPVFSKTGNKAVHLPRFVKNGRIITAQFTPDGALTYVDVNINQRTWNLYRYDPQTEESQLLITLPNPAELQYSVNPFANVAFVRNTASGTMHLIDLSRRQEVATTVPIKHLYADSSGSFVAIVHPDDTLSVFHPQSGGLITKAHVGGKNITLVCTGHRLNGDMDICLKDEQDGYHLVNGAGGLGLFTPPSDDRVLFVEYATATSAIFAKKLTYGLTDWHSGLAFNQAGAVQFNLPLLDGLQRPGKQTIYKHPYLNLIIDESAPMHPVAIDPVTGNQFSYQGEIYGIRCDAQTGEIHQLLSYDVAARYESNSGSGAVSVVSGGKVVAADAVSGSSIIGFSGPINYLLRPAYDKPSFEISSIKPTEYDEVSFDGKYFVFANTMTGDLVYLNPQNPQNLIFAPIGGEPQPMPQAELPQVPAEAQQGHILVEDRYVRQVGAGVVTDLGPSAGNLQYLTNGYYRVTVGETDNVYKIFGSMVENCFWVHKGKESMVVSADKSMIVAVGENGIIRMVFDCRTGKKYYLGQAGLSEVEGTPVEKYYRPRFSKDGKYLTYLAVDTANPVLIGAGRVYQTALCVVGIDNGMQVTRNLSMEVGDDDWEYTLSPFASLAYVRNKDTGLMALVDLRTGLVRTDNAEFMHTDSSGAYTVSIDNNDEVSIYPTGSSTVIDSAFFGNQKITSLLVSYYSGSRNIYTIKTEDGVEHYFFSDTSPVGLQPGQLPAGADFTEGIVLESPIVQFDYESGATAMSLNAASLRQLSGQESLYLDPLFSLIIDNRDPANPVAIDPHTGKKFIFQGTIDFVQYGPEQNGVKPVILVESHKGRQAFFTDPDSTAEVFADFIAGEPGGYYITKCQGSDGLSYYISAPNHGVALKRIDVHKYTQVSFDGRCFLFVDPQSGDAVYLDPAGNQDNPVFIPASPSSPAAPTAQQDDERVKMLLLWRDQVISQRDSWIAQVREAYQPFLEMVPEEFQAAIVNSLRGQIVRLYQAQDREIMARFKAAIEDGAPVNLAGLPFEVFMLRMEKAKQALKAFLAEEEPKVYQKNFEFRKHFYSSVFTALFDICLRQSISIENIDTSLLEVVACGWKIETQEQANLVPVIYELISEIRKAHPNSDLGSAVNIIIQFLTNFAGTNPSVNCPIIANQLRKILKLKPAARTKHLHEMVKVFNEVSDTATIFAFARGKAPNADLQDLWPFAVFLTNEVEQVAARERFIPDGEDRFFAQDPETEGIAISQIMVLEQMRPRQDEEDTIMSIDYLLEHILGFPDLSEKVEQDIMRNITVQRESGASTAETAQNSGDATKEMEDGQLVVSYYVQEGDEGKEFVEEAQDNGTGALQEVALLIPKSTKAAGGQVDLAGFFGTGKYAIFEGVDRLEIISNNGTRAYLFAYQVIPDANGRPSKVRLVQVRQIYDARVQRGVTVRRIKSLDNTIPELDQMLSQRAWKTFCGLAQRKNFKIYFLDHEGNKRQLVVGSTKDPNQPEILCELEFTPAKRSPEDKPMLRIYSTKDMPMQIVDRAGLRVREIPQEYLALIPESLRHFVAKLGIIIQIPLPLIRNRSAFVHEDEYLEDIKKYVAIAFYQALAFKTLTQSSPQFVFENFPHDWETNGAYWKEINADSDAEVMQLAEKINTGRLEEINTEDLGRLRTTGKKLDWEKKFVKLILLLRVATNPAKPQEKISLLSRRKAIQEKIDAERAARQTQLLEEGGYTSGQTPNLEDIPDVEAKIVQAASIDLGHQQMEHPERYVVAPETAEEFELVKLAGPIAADLGIEQVMLLGDEVAFAGAFKVFQGKRTMFLARSIARRLGQPDNRGVQIDQATDTIVHELGHLLEQLVREGNTQGLWESGYVAHLSNFTHDSVGTFAESMKYVAAVSLAHHQPLQISAAEEQRESAAEPDLQSPGAGPGTPSAIEHPNNNVVEARELMEQGELAEAEEFLTQAIEMFNDLIARNADAPADTLDAEIGQAAQNNLQIAQALLQDIKQRKQANQAIAVGRAMAGAVRAKKQRTVLDLSRRQLLPMRQRLENQLLSHNVRILSAVASFDHGTNFATQILDKVSKMEDLFDNLLEIVSDYDPEAQEYIEQMQSICGRLRYIYEKTLEVIHPEKSDTDLDGRIKRENENIPKWHQMLIDIAGQLNDCNQALREIAQRKENHDEQRALNELLGYSEEAQAVIEDRLDMIEGEKPDTLVDANEIVRDLRQLIAVPYKLESVLDRVIVNPVPGRILVQGSRRSIISMITNLVSNALEYAGEDATVTVSIREEEGRVIITVADNGVGIEPVVLDAMGNPFFTTGGTGIGLTECKILAENHGGWLEVESELGVGTTFTINLPAAKVIDQGNAAQDIAGARDQSYEGGITDSIFPGEGAPWKMVPLTGVAPMVGVSGDVITIGDIHAALQRLRDILAGLGLIKKGKNKNGLDDEWLVEGVTVVQGGDIIDRGLEPLETLRYLRLMQQKARAKNSKLIRIIGNHELMYLLRHEHGEWDGAIDLYRFNGGINGMDDSLCNNDAELVAALREDIQNGDLLAVYECGVKLFSHGVVTPDLIQEFEKSHPGVSDPRIFAQSANKLLQEAVTENKFENIIFCLKLGGIIDRDIDGITSSYFRNLTDRQIDELPFDEVVFHDYRYFDSNGSIGVKKGRKTIRSVICGDVAMSAPYVSGMAAIVFKAGVPNASYSAFDSLWQAGEKQAIPVEIIDIFLMDKFFGETFRMPRIRLISREQMDQLSSGHNALRRSQRILVVKEYWENLSLNGKLNFMMHEAMADWCEIKGVPAFDIAMMAEGLKKDEHGFVEASDQRRQQAHLGIDVDRAMEGGQDRETGGARKECEEWLRLEGPFIWRGLNIPPWKLSIYDLGASGPLVAIEKNYHQIVINMSLFDKAPRAQIMYQLARATVRIDAINGTGFYSHAPNTWIKIGAWQNYLQARLEKEAADKLFKKSLLQRAPHVNRSTEVPVMDVLGLPAPQITIKDKMSLLKSLYTYAGGSTGGGSTAELALLNFAQEINGVFATLKERYFSGCQEDGWEILYYLNANGKNHPFLADFENLAGNQFAQYPRSYFARNTDIYYKILESTAFNERFNALVAKFRQTGEPQTLHVGVVGAGYGQEPVRVAVDFTRALRRRLSEQGLNSRAVMLKVSVVSYPDAVFEKVKNNEIIFPNSMIEGEFTPEEIAEYFSASDDGTGYKRAKATDSMFEFNGIDLLAADINVPSVLRNALDVFLVHNVLQYLRPELCAGEDYFVQQSVRIADYFDASLREGGILSISTDGGVAAELSRQILACQEEKYIDLKHPEQEIKDTLARLAIKSSSSVDKTARQFIFSCNQEIRGGVSDETSRFIRILLGSDLAVLDGQVKGEMTVRLSKLQARVVDLGSEYYGIRQDIDELISRLSNNYMALGAQVSGVRYLGRLLRLLNLMRRSQSIPNLSVSTSDREVIEFAIGELRKVNLVYEVTDEGGNRIIRVKEEAFSHRSPAIRRLALAIQTWAINRGSPSGVKAINFQDEGGIWTIVGFENELNNPVTLLHEQREVGLRKQGLSWVDAHNQTVQEQGAGQSITPREVRVYPAGRQQVVGAMEGQQPPRQRIKMIPTRTIEDFRQLLNKRLATEMEPDKDWLRFITPKEAYEFHHGWRSGTQGYYQVSFKGKVFVFPVRIWQKMEAWMRLSRNLERVGSFLISPKGDVYEVVDFVPRGSVVTSPVVGDVDYNKEDPDTQQLSVDTFEIFFLVGDEGKSLMAEYGIDLTQQAELEPKNILRSNPDLTAIRCHSHFIGSHYPHGPSQKDRQSAGEFEFVFSVDTGRGYLYDKISPIQEVKQEHSIQPAVQDLQSPGPWSGAAQGGMASLDVVDRWIQDNDIQAITSHLTQALRDFPGEEGERIVREVLNRVHPGQLSLLMDTVSPWLVSGDAAESRLAEIIFRSIGGQVQVSAPEQPAPTLQGMSSIVLGRLRSGVDDQITATDVDLIIQTLLQRPLRFGDTEARLSRNEEAVVLTGTQGTRSASIYGFIDWIDHFASAAELREILGNVAAATQASTMVTGTGGIDFRSLPIITQPMGISATKTNLTPFARVKLPVDPQWQEVEQMVRKGIVPSYQRIKDYLEESCNTPECQQKVNQALSCIADILRLEEEEVNPTAPVLREILILLESGQSAQQLQVALAKIEIPEEEPAEPVEP